MPLLKRYWFEFVESEAMEWKNGWPVAGRFGRLPAYGCGITAYDYEDALQLLRRWILNGNDELPTFSKVIENVDVSTLDAPDVPRNIGCPVWRGVWYPRINLFRGPDME